MDEHNQNPEVQQPVPQQAKILQPSEAFVQEVQSKAADTMPESPQGLTSHAPVFNGQPQTNTPPFNTNNIYPSVGASHQPPVDMADNNKTKLLSFSDGYSVGGTIFWYQLIATIVFGIIMYGITTSVLKTRSYSLSILVGLIAYTIQYLILIYIPFSVVRSEAVEEPIWLSLFGVAAQSVIIAATFALVDILVVRTIINHGSSYAFPHIGSSGVAAIGVFVWIGLLIASYFLTRLAWGTAYALYSKLSKVVVKTIGIIVIAIFIGGIVRHYLAAYNSHKNLVQTNTVSATQPTSLSRYKIGGSPSFSVDFYKGSYIIYIEGKPQVVYNSPATGQAFITFVKSNTTTTTCSTPNSQQFTFYVQGSQSLGCYIPPDSSYGYFKSQGQNYAVNVYSANQQLQTIKSIFNSITIN